MVKSGQVDPLRQSEGGVECQKELTNDTANQIALLYGRMVNGDFVITIVTEEYCLIQLSSV
jgi:hypothetical protein